MDAQKLVRMANQIALFFAGESDRKVAVDGVVGHIKRFWEPRMRKTILAAFDAGETAGMHELVKEALRGHRQILMPTK